VLAILALSPITLRGAAETQPQPIWRFDFKQLGYQKPDCTHAKVYAIGYVRPQVSFLGPDAIVAGFVTGSPKQPPITGTWTLHVVVLDSHTGDLRMHKTFPVDGHESGIFVSSNNQLIVWLGSTLTLLSPGFEPLKQIQLPKSSNPAWTFLRLSLSQSRRTLLVASSDIDKRPNLPVQIVDTSTLEPRASCSYSQLDDLPETVAEAHAARNQGRGLFVSEFCKDWAVVPEPKECANTWPGSVHFVNEDALAVTCSNAAVKNPFGAYPNTFVLLQPTGTVLMTVRLGKKQSADSVLVSQDGRQFALVSSFLGGVQIPAFDMYFHDAATRVALYDTATRTELLAIKIVPHARDLALAPDGSMLAAVVEDQVQVFNLGR
jgi:hypothetical protein